MTYLVEDKKQNETYNFISNVDYVDYIDYYIIFVVVFT